MANIAINGFGRIGRNLFRIIEQQQNAELNIVAINDLMSHEHMQYLAQFDTILGPFPSKVRVSDDTLKTQNTQAKIFHEPDISKLPWRDLGIDIVVEATGVFRQRVQLEQHLSAGAKKVLLTVPSKDPIDATIVLGVNDDQLKKEHQIVSNASCTTNCLAPLAKVLHDAFGIERALMTTVHAYTNDQRVMDMSHKDPRRGRVAAQNIIPTTTGAALAVGKIIPELNGKIDGMALRVPVVNGSIIDLTATLDKKATVSDINKSVKDASENVFKGIIEYSQDPLVSTDILQNTHSSIFDATSTKVLGDRMIKVLSWYDNEWGYSNRLFDLLKNLKKHL